MKDAFQALAHPDRRRIVRILKERGEVAAGELAEEFDFSKPTLSHHLHALSDAGLLRRERRGRFIYYALDMSVFGHVVEMLFDLVGEMPLPGSQTTEPHALGASSPSRDK